MDDTVDVIVEIARTLAVAKIETVKEQGEEDDAQTQVHELY